MPEETPNSYIQANNQNVTKSTKLVYNTTVKYVCWPGYTVAYGNATRTCNENMEWTGSVPNCVEIVCPTLKAPANCDLTINGTNLNSTALYKCHFGYRIKNILVDKFENNVLRRRCNESAMWNREEPICECESRESS